MAMVHIFEGYPIGSSEAHARGTIRTPNGAIADARRWPGPRPMWEISFAPQNTGEVTLRDVAQLAEDDTGIAIPNPASLDVIAAPRDQRPQIDIAVYDPTYKPFVTADISSISGIHCEILVPQYDEQLPAVALKYVEKLSPFIEAQFLSHELEAPLGESPSWRFCLRLLSLDTPIIELWRFAKRLDGTVRAPWAASLDSRDDVLLALRSGHPEYLLGLAENDWLEVKSQIHQLDSLAGKVELAKDVAQFANSPGGGVLAFGFRTKSNGKSDQICKVTPLNADRKALQRIADILDSRIYPHIANLSIESIQDSAGEYIFITIPPQPDSLKPFIVGGAEVQGQGLDSAFLIPLRRGAGIRSVTGRELHALLAGKLFNSQGPGTAENRDGTANLDSPIRPPREN